MKALVLAGGFPQIALINELHKRNIFVVLADYNIEPVAKKYCDKYYQVSTLDVEAIENIAVSEKIDFLITVCTDQALQTVAYVAERLGLPCYIDSATGMRVTNKAYMKEVFDKHSITTAKSYVMGQFDLDKLRDIHYPLIVKPVDCNSSKGVKKVTNQAELEIAFKQAIEFSRTNTAIVEEFIVGPELTVDVYNGNATIFGYYVKDPERFGVVEFDENRNVISVEEKPAHPKSNYCITGLYFYPAVVAEIAENVKPSARGELEITTLNDMYLNIGALKAQILGRGFAWLDTGTMDSLMAASTFVQTVQNRQGTVISAPEEIAYHAKWISKAQLIESAKLYGKSPYGEHLMRVAEDKFMY